MRSVVLVSALSLVLDFLPLHAFSQTEPPLRLQRIVSGLSRPDFFTTPPGDTHRAFVLEQHRGTVRVVDLGRGALLSTPFLTITGVTTGNEQGLLGLAFHPNYASNGLFYVNYTTTGIGTAGHSEVVRYQVQGDPNTSNVADPSSKAVLLTYAQPEANHNAGWLGFGPDGFLYISVGDGGGGNDVHGTFGNGQNRDTLLGKMLRIDVNNGSPYGIPVDNPFKGMSGMREEIWAFGLRNPWRCSFDRLTGNLWIGDVGQDTREEVDVIPRGVPGLNFGWRPREGTIQNPVYPNETTVTPATRPVYDYGHGSLGNCIIGGYFYGGSAIPAFQGAYIFGDNGSGRFWTFRYSGGAMTNLVERTAELNSGSPKPVSPGALSSFGEDASGELYVCDLLGGNIYKIVSAAPTSIQLSEPGVVNGMFRFQFNAAPNQSYHVEASPTFAPPSWQTVTNLAASSTSTNIIITDSLTGSERFYRVRTP